MADKLTTLIEFLKQPSTIKALGTLAGAAGYVVDPSKAVEILGAIAVFTGAVNLVYDNNPRSPNCPTVKELDKILTKEKVAEIMAFRKKRAAV